MGGGVTFTADCRQGARMREGGVCISSFIPFTMTTPPRKPPWRLCGSGRVILLLQQLMMIRNVRERLVPLLLLRLTLRPRLNPKCIP